MILLTGSGQTDSFIQFITVLLIFLVVLLVTYFVTRWVASFQKTQMNGRNIEVIETQRITSSKYIQIVKIGSHYYAMAVCKDTVTVIGEIQAEDISFSEEQKGTTLDFKSIWEKVRKTSTDGDKTDRKK